MNLDELVKEIRSHPGVTRKRLISEVINFFPTYGRRGPRRLRGGRGGHRVLAIVLLLAADGIMESLIKSNPFYAGYFPSWSTSTIFRPWAGTLAMVDIVAMKDEKVCAQVMRGMETAVRSSASPLSAAIPTRIATTTPSTWPSSGRQEGTGSIYILTPLRSGTTSYSPWTWTDSSRKLPYAWDTTTKKDAAVPQADADHERDRQEAPGPLGQGHQQPGASGPWACCWRPAEEGGGRPPHPRPKGVDLAQWLKAYQGCGFRVTANPRARPGRRRPLRFGRGDRRGGRQSGRTTKLCCHRAQERTLFDLSTEKITGCEPTMQGRDARLRDEMKC